MFQSRADTVHGWTRRAACAGFAALAAWSVLALGDDLLAPKARLDIPAEPIASALMPLSTQADGQAAAADPGVASGSEAAGQSDVNVINPGPLPPAQDLAGSSLAEFIRHHGTIYALDAHPFGPARWRGVMGETICPRTMGLDPAFNDFVSARIRAVAAYVGAPAATESRCAVNVVVIFTSKPRKVMEQAFRAGDLMRGVDMNALRPFSKTLDVSGQHTVQGLWRVGEQLRGLWQLVVLPTGPGNRVRSPYAGPSIYNALLVINTQKLASSHIGTIADYLAFVTLSAAQNPDHCDQLPSILDLMSASCSQRPAPKTLTAADLAYLRAIYSRKGSFLDTPDEDEIEALMSQQLTGQEQQK